MSMRIVHSASSSCSQRYYNYLYSLCLELTNSVSVGLLCSQSPLGLFDLHSTSRNPSVSVLVSSNIIKLP